MWCEESRRRRGRLAKPHADRRLMLVCLTPVGQEKEQAGFNSGSSVFLRLIQL
jgi:hypothetical protein